jgi:hypothetical protein
MLNSQLPRADTLFPPTEFRHVHLEMHESLWIKCRTAVFQHLALLYPGASLLFGPLRADIPPEQCRHCNPTQKAEQDLIADGKPWDCYWPLRARVITTAVIIRSLVQSTMTRRGPNSFLAGPRVQVRGQELSCTRRMQDSARMLTWSSESARCN